jgi:hypothetical protein
MYCATTLTCAGRVCPPFPASDINDDPSAVGGYRGRNRDRLRSGRTFMTVCHAGRFAPRAGGGGAVANIQPWCRQGSEFRRFRGGSEAGAASPTFPAAIFASVGPGCGKRTKHRISRKKSRRHPVDCGAVFAPSQARRAETSGRVRWRKQGARFRRPVPIDPWLAGARGWTKVETGRGTVGLMHCDPWIRFAACLHNGSGVVAFRGPVASRTAC